MTYQEILRNQLHRRVRMNPSFSLRAFARSLDIQPSKLSEILNMKKGLSNQKAIDLCERLRLASKERDVFLTSVAAQHSRSQRERIAAQQKLSMLLKPKLRRKSVQRNAWYFGAVEALMKRGLNSELEIAKTLGITALQVESAKRFIKRIAKLHPDVTEIRYEPESVTKKISDSLVSREDSVQMETQYAVLTPTDAEKLVQAAKESIARDKARKGKTKVQTSEQLYLFNINAIQLTEGNELC